MYRSIWLEYYSLSLRYLENTGASVVCLLPKHPAAACLIWQSYHGTSHTHTSPAALNTDKGLLQVQSTSKTTGDTLPPGVPLPFGPCSSLTNAENEVPISQRERLLSTKEHRDVFKCHTCLNEYLNQRSSCYVPAWILLQEVLTSFRAALLLFWRIKETSAALCSPNVYDVHENEILEVWKGYAGNVLHLKKKNISLRFSGGSAGVKNSNRLALFLYFCFCKTCSRRVS